MPSPDKGVQGTSQTATTHRLQVDLQPEALALRQQPNNSLQGTLACSQFLIVWLQRAPGTPEPGSLGWTNL